MEGVQAHFPPIDFTSVTGFAPTDLQADEETADRGDRPVQHGDLGSKIVDDGTCSDDDGP